jgi:hypothetical protein
MSGGKNRWRVFGQRPRAGADLVEGRKARVLRADIAGVEGVAAGAAELERVAACGDHIAVDHAAGPRVSVLPPKKANTIAGLLFAEMVPALNIVVLPSVAMASKSPMIEAPALLMTLPLAIEIAGPPRPLAIDMVPEFVTLTTLPEMAPEDAAPMPPEMVPKFVIVGWALANLKWRRRSL